MFSVDEFIRSIKDTLEKRSDSLIGNLQNIFTYNFSSRIDLLDFSPSIEPTRFEVSIIMFSMDKEANEVLNEGNDSTAFAGSEEVLPEVEYYNLNDSQLDDFFDFYEQNEETLLSQEQQIFADWFCQCWERAGGAALNLPSYFVFHDDYKSYDLKNKRWIDDEEKWS
ncbi:hypothetical protein [Planomicrobium sp. CPCC 101110]|uniref:hypothetical protein n=1 Tax=Planomicrobium sp. CPCC 101110 TaxID=2599619 RepID=UPI0011B746C5|nr:hypothetical protein [Planomicrobium sp. CPCC 101110]TWT26034.1 hypothetical protein FQV30_09595 [Planomicrobium sp. CPCC 101110]